MRQYLLYSSYAHFALFALIFLLSRSPFSHKTSRPYYIDFIGGSTVITMEKTALKQGAEISGPKSGATIHSKQAAQDPEDFYANVNSLPKPSVLNSSARLFDEEQKTAPGGENGSPLITDTANFPYPWYITQVREALWNSWIGKMPSSGALKCSIKFDISRAGAVKDIKVENSSGNRLFDYAALSSVESAAPFQELPEDFYEERLSVHVEFKTR